MVAARFSVPHAQLLRNIETDMPKDEDDVERGLEADRKLTKKMSVRESMGACGPSRRTSRSKTS